LSAPVPAVRRALAIALAVAALAASAQAQDYPGKPLRLLVPFSPGGGTDIIARALGQHLAGVFGQPVVIDNRPGGNTVIATDLAVNARPDGYTLLMQINTLTALPAMAKPGDKVIALSDLTPVSLVAILPHVLVVNRNVQATSLRELVTLAKQSPVKLLSGIPGAGTPVHLASAWFASLAGIQLTHVPYKGAAEYTTAVLSGEVQMVFGSVSTALPHVRSGALKALGVTTAKRARQLPEVPTIAESGFAGYDISSWYGLLAPAKTPQAVIARLADETARAVRIKAFEDRLQEYELIGNTPAQFAEFLRKDAAISLKIIAQSGAKLE